ncbi:acyl--CoA ligase, partial [candidate division WOR-3 bacterium]|nr:acyl--CoA ligase [candidate division WOR-3 bacterium]
MKTLKQIRNPREILPIPAMLERTIRTYPHSVAMQRLTTLGWEKWSYEDLLDLIIKRASELKSKHIEKGDRIAIYGPNSPEWIVTYLAIQWIGAICVPIDNRLSLREVHYLIKDSGSKILFSSIDGVREVIDITAPIDIGERVSEGQILERAE